MGSKGLILWGFVGGVKGLLGGVTRVDKALGSSVTDVGGEYLS